MRFRVACRMAFVSLLLTLGLGAGSHWIVSQDAGFNPALPLTHVENGANSA